MTKGRTPPTDFIEQAAYLRKIADHSPDEFEDALKLLKIGRRKAYYLIDVDKTFEEISATKEEKLAVGWTKLKMMNSYVTEENWKQLFAEAMNRPVHEFQEILEGNYVETAKHCVLLYFFDEEYKLFAKVLEEHGAKKKARGLQGKEAALLKALRKLKPKP